MKEVSKTKDSVDEPLEWFEELLGGEHKTFELKARFLMRQHRNCAKKNKYMTATRLWSVCMPLFKDRFEIDL
jgi:hypothetical protein